MQRVVLVPGVVAVVVASKYGWWWTLLSWFIFMGTLEVYDWIRGRGLDAVLRENVRVIGALGLACEAALAHVEELRMDTPEDQAVVEKLGGMLRLALGLKGLQVFKQALEGPIGRQRHEARMWRRGTALQVAIEFPAGVGKEQADQWREVWRANYEGTDGETTER